MNIFNRLIIILLILVAMILIPLTLILPEQAEIALRYAADVIRANLEWLNGLTPVAQVGVRLMLAAVGMIAFLIGLLFLGLEVIRIRRNTVRLRDGSGELMMDGVAGHLSYYIDLLPDVIRVKPTVKSSGKSVRTDLVVETVPGINVPEKSAEVRETARQVLEEQLGLQIKGEIKVIIKPVPYPKVRQGKRPPVTRVESPIVPRPHEPEPIPDQALAERPPTRCDRQGRRHDDGLSPHLWEDFSPEDAEPPQEEKESQTIEVKSPYRSPEHLPVRCDGLPQLDEPEAERPPTRCDRQGRRHDDGLSPHLWEESSTPAADDVPSG